MGGRNPVARRFARPVLSEWTGRRQGEAADAGFHRTWARGAAAVDRRALLF